MPRPVCRCTLPALAAALALATPAAADITSVASGALLGATSQTGEVVAGNVRIDFFDFTDLHETVEGTTEGGHARAVQDTTISQTADSVTVTASGSIDYSHCCAGERTQNNFGKGARASNSFFVQVCADGRVSFTASVTASIQSSDEDSVRADLLIDSFAEAPLVDERLADEPGFARSASRTVSGVADPVPPGVQACVEVDVDLAGLLNDGQPSGGGSWSITLAVGSAPETEGDVFVWTGSSQGSFADPLNWDPVGPASQGVPNFVDGVRGDAALVNVPFPLTLDLAGVAAASQSRAALPRGPASQRRMGRLAVARTQSLRPTGGTLILDNLGLDLLGTAATVEGRSLEVGSGATLTLDQGIVQARHVAIGSDGDGTLAVQGPDGAFTTLGRFGLGADGDGNVDITNGATVTSAETVLGEKDGQGSARITGQGSLWQAGNLAVGLEDDAALTIEGGARVESNESFVDFGLSGDERANAVVKGKDGSGTPSTWVPTGLDIGPRGRVSIEEGAALGALNLGFVVRIGTSGSDADCLLGQACLEVTDGSVSFDGVVVGANGAGKLRIGPAGRVSATLGVLVGDASGSRGEAAVAGPSAESQIDTPFLLVGTGIGSHGELVLAGGSRVRTGIGGVGGEPGSSGLIELQATGSEATVLVVEGGTAPHLDLGVDLPAPDASIFGATGELALANGRLELNDADLNIRNTGEVTGTGRIDGFGVSFVSNNGRIGCGVLVDAAYTQGPEGVLECPQASLAPAPQLNPLAASRFLRSVRRKPAPPLPPPGPFVVTGDAILDGTLLLQFLNGFAPQQGDAFELLDVSGVVSGAFASVVVRGLTVGAEGFASDIVGGKLTLTSLTDAVALPTVSLTGKTKLKEKKKAGMKLKLLREGDTSAPLLVSYTIRGTAENGIDYQLLPGTLEIPAGKKSAKLVVRPRTDGRIEGPETIEIELLPGADYTPSLFSKLEIVLTSADKLKEKK
jgi:T5SS/PEP-CTERM-associated repeat protein